MPVSVTPSLTRPNGTDATAGLRLWAPWGAIHESRGTEPLRVGVVYGAQHMIAVVHVLSARFGYVPRAGDWLTVFDY